jgi:hypothetical protein
MIPTWTERCEKFDNEIVTNAMIQQVMQEEIDELRSKMDKMLDDIVSLTDDLFSERRECLKLKKELALQRLSDIGQVIELTNEEIMEICDEVNIAHKNWGYFQIEFARGILKKASEK